MESPTIPQSTELEQLKAKAKNGVLWLAVQNVGSKSMGMVIFVALARLLTPEAFGLVAAAAVFLAVSEMLMEQGLGNALIQREDLRPEHLDTAFWIQMSAAVTVAGLGIAAAPLLSTLYGLPSLTPIIQVILLNTPISAFCAVQESLLQRELKFKDLARRRLMANLVGGSTAVGLAVAGQGAWSLVMQQLVGNTTAAFLLWRASRWRPGKLVRTKALTELMGFSISLFVLQGFAVLKTRADHFFIGLFLGPVALGLYATANRLVDVSISLFVETFTKLSLPLFSRMQADPDVLRRTYGTAVFAAGVFGFPASVALSALAPNIVKVALGSQWMDVAPLVQILASMTLVRAIAAPNSAVILAKGHSGFRLAVVIVHVTTSLLLVALLANRGVEVVAWVNVICAASILPVSAWMVWKLIGLDMKYYAHLMAPSMLASAVMLVAMTLLRHYVVPSASSTRQLAYVAAAGAACYLPALWFLSSRFRASVRRMLVAYNTI